MIDKEAKQFRYGLTIKALHPVPEGGYLVVRFENPRGGFQNLEMAYKENEKGNVILTSDPVEGVASYTNYEIAVSLFESEKKMHLIGTHKQELQSFIGYKELGW